MYVDLVSFTEVAIGHTVKLFNIAKQHVVYGA